ncbi:MAG: glycosyltransferase family 2 protein [Bacteroidia bacterium]|jgi:dolichol-phosphate mannosyltransferase|nr:glycosyltransferase family 2 protein [Bacteroidia bacterium]
MKLSIVSPVYQAERIIEELIKRIKLAVEQITGDYEIILVEDFSPDNSWEKIAALASTDSRIKGIKLSRNFGQHHAITAGLDACSGEWVVVMDCDLQDRPEEIISLYNKAQEGFDIVFARRVNRQDGFIKKQTSVLFYKLFSYLSGVPQDGTIANFGIYHKKVIAAINTMREPMRAFSPMARWVGFNKTAIDVKHDERFEGKSSYNWGRLINLALDIALAYSDKPLRMVIKTGFIISSLSILYALLNVIFFFSGIIKVSGFASLIISIWFLSGLIIFILGIIGLYIGKTFDGIKNRPLYIVDKKTF